MISTFRMILKVDLSAAQDEDEPPVHLFPGTLRIREVVQHGD